MNAELEKMIRFATEDGSITDKEREIIIRKAQEMGADIDEVEIMLESELVKHNKVVEASKPVIQRPKERVKKCPNCGATITESMLTCPECGYDFSIQSETSMDIQQRIERLRMQLLEAEQNSENRDICLSRKKTIISTFTVPITKEGLLQFLEFSYSSYVGQGESGLLRETWKGKFVQALNSLKRYGYSDLSINKIVSHYETILAQDSKEDKWRKRLSFKTIGKIGCLIPFIILVLYSLIGLRMEKIKDDNKSDSLEKTISALINNGEYEEALLKTADIKYSWERVKKQDVIYEYWINSVKTADIDKAIHISKRINDESRRDEIYDDLVVLKIENIISEGEDLKAKEWAETINDDLLRNNMLERIDNIVNH